MSIKECRICYEDETETELLFIQPCQCKGSSANVHAECLDKWRQTNRGRLPFIQCQECHTYYNIGYEYPIERYKFPEMLPLNNNVGGVHIAMNICWLTLPVMIMGVDPNFNIVRATYIGSDTNHFIRYLKKVINKEEGVIAYCYYYSLFIFVSVMCVQLLLGWRLKKNIVNQRRYWKKAVLPYLGALFFNMHFLYLYAFTFDNHYSPWLLISGCFSLFSYIIITLFCHIHNRIIDSLNTKNKESILDYYQDPSCEMTIGHYRQNVVLQVNNVLNDAVEAPFESESSDDSEERSRAESGDSSISFTSISSVSTELL